MNILPRKNLILLFISILIVAVGFIIMKLESAPHGYGPWALTVAPILVIAGFILGIVSIFYGTEVGKGLIGQKLFLISGWAVFLVSLIVYLATLEETASLWDCAEFIACAYKLQVPHAPGAPLFLMIGRLFSMMALGDELKVAFWVNVTSALSSALAVMFTFWSVVMLGRKIAPNATDFSLVIAGVVGAFTIAVADSFWFSAVEAETYAMATLFLILAFWAILKWDQATKAASKVRWLIFIFYVFGLSIGVHPMSLLVLPALAVVIMFKFRDFSWSKLVMAVFLGAMAILFLNHIVLFGLPDLMKYFDIFFVNSLNLPFYSGAIFLIVLLVAIGVFIYLWSLRKGRRTVSIFMVGMLYFLMGYSSYFMIIIRSQQDPSIDENNPENLMTLASYLKRESYGGWPFLHGQYYTAKIESFEQGSPVYTKMENQYQVTDHITKYIYEKTHQTILPRMYSNQDRHVQTYREWTGLKEGEKPSFLDNMQFMFTYQFGHMYLRYLMFNFSGRESDIQHANWLGPLDVFREYPEYLKKNKAHNNFLMLPLLLGIFGMFYHYKNHKAGFWAVMAFFMFLGLILVFYLNSPPNEPRERDYIYVGSYLAFAIWCGIGALGISRFLETKFHKYPSIKYAGILVLMIPLMMLIIGFDDHNRSGRTLQVDHARNTLASCAPNAILFTGGDNDTFPLWYVQEVEGFRTDVRVIVLSYFNGDWYIDQMKRKIYKSEELPISLDSKHYRQGGLNDALPFVENPRVKGAINLSKFMELIRGENKALQVQMSGGTVYNSIPSRTFYLDIDKEYVSGSALVPEEYLNHVPEKLIIPWKGNFLEKSAFMALDLIDSNNWERPIYFNMTSLNSISLDLKNHVLQEGQVYRLLPVQTEREGAVDVVKMYENLMIKSVFHDLHDQDIYYNHEDYQLRILQTTKSSYNLLATKLLDQGDLHRAEEVLDFLTDNFLGGNIELDFSTISTVDLLFKAGKKDVGLKLAESVYQVAREGLEFYQNGGFLASDNSRMQLFLLRQLYDVSIKYGYDDLAERCSIKLNEYISQLNG